MAKRGTLEEKERRRKKTITQLKKISEESQKNKDDTERALSENIKLNENLLMEYKNNLRDYLEKKKQYIAEIIVENTKDELNLPLVMRALGRDFACVVGQPEYSAQELAIVFEYYQDVLAEINKKHKLPPTRQNFCAFCGITTSTYDTYLQSNDLNKKLVMQRIEDYIIENNWTLATKGTLNAYAVEKRTKIKGIGGGYTEAREDININQRTLEIKSADEMKKMLDGIIGK